MVKCMECGHLCPDTQKFCSECGAKLSEPEPEKPVCTACGAINEPGTKFCGRCGCRLVGEEPQAVQNNDDFDAQTFDSTDGAKNSGGNFSAKVNSAKEKVLTFESKHNVIVNALVAICAFVVMLVSLLGSVKFMGYTESFVPSSDVSAESTEIEGSYIEIKRSVFDFFGALGYIGLDYEDESDVAKLEKITEEYAAACEAAEAEAEKWAMKHSDADESEFAKHYAKALEKHLSDFNYLAYVLAMAKPEYGNVGNSSHTLIKGDPGLYYDAVMTVIYGLAVAALSIATAIVALVFLILAIVGIIKKKPQKGLYKYLATTMVISGVALIITALMPMTKAGGGAFAVTLFSAIVYTVCGAVGTLIKGDTGLRTLVKRFAMAAVGIIAFYLLCTNTVNYKIEYNNDYMSGKSIEHVPFGYFLYVAVGNMYAPHNAAAGVAYRFGGYEAITVNGIYLYVFTVFMLSYAYAAMCRAIKRLALGDVEKSSPYKFMMTAIILMVVTAAVAGIVSPAMFKAIDGTKYDSALGERVDTGMVHSFAVRAQVIVSAVLLLISFVFGKVFNPEKQMLKAPKAGEQWF